MKPSVIALLASAFAVAHFANAQAPRESAPAPTQAPEVLKVSDAELDTFATIYVDLLATVEKFKGEIQSAKNEQETQAIETRMHAESIAKVAQRGWSPEKFNSVTEAINKDSALADKAAKLIDEKS